VIVATSSLSARAGQPRARASNARSWASVEDPPFPNGHEPAAGAKALADGGGAALDGGEVDRRAQRHGLLALAHRGRPQVGEHGGEVPVLVAEEGVQEVRRIWGCCLGDALERNAGVAQHGVAGADPIEQVDGDLLSRALVLHDRGAALDGDHVGLDRDVSAGDARLVQQTGLLEEGVHELPQDVVGGLVDLLDDLRVTAVHGEGVVGGGGRSSSGEGEGQQAPGAGVAQDALLLRARGPVREDEQDVVGPGEVQALGTASAGRARLPTMTGCRNSTATCAASVAAAPRPQASSVPPRASLRASAWQARARRSCSRSRNALSARSRSATSASRRWAVPAGALTRSRCPELGELLLIGIAEELEEPARLAGLLLVDLGHGEADVDEDPVADLDVVRVADEQADVHVAPHAGDLGLRDVELPVDPLDDLPRDP
jgi:hypothetical protein